MVFNSRVVPVFMLWLPKISGSSIVVKLDIAHRQAKSYQVLAIAMRDSISKILKKSYYHHL